jgi:hypothetical protein
MVFVLGQLVCPSVWWQMLEQVKFFERDDSSLSKERFVIE